MDYLPLSECRERGVYRLSSRHLALGVFREDPRHFGTAGFVGIRTKFGDRYLDTEYHWDEGPPHGTAKPLEKIGELPKGVDPAPYAERVCQTCGEDIWWTGPPAPAPWECASGCGDPRSLLKTNKALFKYLDNLTLPHE